MNDEPLTIPFEQKTEYWLTRALRRHKAGDLRGAALLYRKAARQSKQDDDEPVLYAEALRELGCHAASNREATAALAANPSRFTLYALIAENCSDMGLKHQAADAYSLFVSFGQALIPDFDPWDYDVMIEESYEMQPQRKARQMGLINIAARRMGTGDYAKVRDALYKALRTPLGELKPLYRAVIAEFMRLMGDNRQSSNCAWRVVLGAPDIAIAVLAANVLGALKARERQGFALLYCAMNARTDKDEALTFSALSSAGALKLLTGMLARRLRERPHSLQSNYHMALCMLLRGRLSAALQRAHLCRELDPDDMYAEALLDAVNAARSKRAAKARAAELTPYGTLPHRAAEALAARLMRGEGTQDERAVEICSTPALRTRYLRLLAITDAVPPLDYMCGLCPTPYIEELLREALMTPDLPEEYFHYALAAFRTAGTELPFTVVSHGRMLAFDPDGAQDLAASFMQRRMVRLINKSAEYALAGGYMPMALETLSRMSRGQRLMMLNNDYDDWALALAMRVACEHGTVAPIVEPFEELTRGRARRLAEHCARLRPHKRRRKEREE